jgi:hypothetical protein
MIIGILEEITSMILEDSLFDSALAECVRENNIDVSKDSTINRNSLLGNHLMVGMVGWLVMVVK